VEWLVGLAIAVGVVGVVVPVLPGLLLAAGAVSVWAVANEVWWLLAIVLLLATTTLLLKFLIPARTTREAASVTALAVGAVAALIGFFVVPVVGLIIGFLVGVLATETVRTRDLAAAWSATVTTLRSIGLTIAVELVAVVLIAALWVAALVVT